MIRQLQRSKQGVSSAASDVYKRQVNKLCFQFEAILSMLNFQQILQNYLQSQIKCIKVIEVSHYTEFIKQIYNLSLIHISEPTRPLYISYAVFCLKKKKLKINNSYQIN
eukprot:TRINITY_DN30030_c0_g1_i1.p1 TRINITY_DN30030_c0_g1~~TRINITY_DN30030_c0_g1_i1.p1  ORF type:complete len:109 (-),score=21.03 TRINITY_DN30030_c0_g1_i1:100-426(-)